MFSKLIAAAGGFVFFLLFASQAFAQTWQGPPTCSPIPCNNVPEPINVGATAQTKSGAIGATLIQDYDSLWMMGPNRYINFNPTQTNFDDTGYGFWDNAGTIEYKNSGGSWQPLSAGASQWVNAVSPAGAIYYNGGNVGIGNATPASALTVQSNVNCCSANFDGSSVITASGNANNIALAIQNTALGGHDWRLISTANASALGGSKLILWDNSAASNWARITIDASGNVGIDNSSPATTLDVKAPGAIRVGSAYISDAGTSAQFASNAWWTGSAWVVPNAAAYSSLLQAQNGTGDIVFWSTQTKGLSDFAQRMRILQNGNVAIGNITPTQKLDVNGVIITEAAKPTGAGDAAGTNVSGGYYDLAANHIGTKSSLYSYGSICAGNGAGDCSSTGGTKISNNVTTNWGGNYQSIAGAGMSTFSGISGGTMENAAVNGPTQIVDVANGSAAYTEASYGPHSATAYAASSYSEVEACDGSCTHQAQLYADNSMAQIYVNGNSYANAFLYLSDRRLKKNIEPLSGNLARVLALQPVTYLWIDTASNPSTQQIGFIAQDVEKVAPWVVSTNPQTGIKAIDYPKLTPLLVGSVQELNAKIDAQQKQLDAQQAEIDALKAEVESLKK